jgi:hypothetical protein
MRPVGFVEERERTHLLTMRPVGLVWKNARGARSTARAMSLWMRVAAVRVISKKMPLRMKASTMTTPGGGLGGGWAVVSEVVGV